MTVAQRELHVEHLLGCRVRDRDGRVVGRLEECRIDVVRGETVVTEFHIGTAALLERLGGAALRLPFLSAIQFRRTRRAIPWELMDLSDPEHPRLRVAIAELGDETVMD